MSEPKSEYKVEVKNLTKYFGDLHVLNDISFPLMSERVNLSVLWALPAAVRPRFSTC